MRIPLNNLCRAFPELDHLSDHECAELRRRVATRRDAHLIILAGAGLTFVVMFIGSIYVVDSLSGMHDGLFALILLVGAPPVAMLLVRDAIIRRFLVAAMHAHAHCLHCPTCAYLLIGLDVVQGEVICPECGQVAVVSHNDEPEIERTPSPPMAAPPRSREDAARWFEATRGWWQWRIW